jgi:hypothetical protein
MGLEPAQDVMSRALPIDLNMPEDSPSASSEGEATPQLGDESEQSEASREGATAAKANSPAPAKPASRASKAPVALAARRARMAARGRPAPARAPAGGPMITREFAQKPHGSPTLSAKESSHVKEQEEETPAAAEEADTEATSEESHDKPASNTIHLTMDPSTFVEVLFRLQQNDLCFQSFCQIIGVLGVYIHIFYTQNSMLNLLEHKLHC